MRGCGHVICQICVGMFVTKTKTCFVCEEKVKSKDIIPLVCEGTGYSSIGNVQVIKNGLAFQ